MSVFSLSMRFSNVSASVNKPGTSLLRATQMADLAFQSAVTFNSDMTFPSVAHKHRFAQTLYAPSRGVGMRFSAESHAFFCMPGRCLGGSELEAAGACTYARVMTIKDQSRNARTQAGNLLSHLLLA
jgi:hypothetical protein